VQGFHHDSALLGDTALTGAIKDTLWLQVAADICGLFMK
jgi:hypothetical protein